MTTHKAMVTDAPKHEDWIEHLCPTIYVRFTRGPNYERAFLCVDDGEPDMRDVATMSFGQARLLMAAYTAALAQAETQPGREAMHVIDPDQWEPCSPDWLKRGGNCACAPRVWDHLDKNHWHPKIASPVPAKREAGVVKALEWEFVMTYTARWPDGDVAYYIDQSFGSYGFYFRTVRWPEETIYDGDDLSSAQEAAQADYKRRVLSAISTSSTPADGEDRAAPVTHLEMRHGPETGEAIPDNASETTGAPDLSPVQHTVGSTDE